MFQIQFQHIRILPRKLLCAIHRRVRAFADAARIRVENKSSFKQRLDDLTQRMMHHAVAKRRGGNQARLGVVNAKRKILARRVRLVFQFRLQARQIFFQIIFKPRHIAVAALAARRALERAVQITKRGDLRIEMFICFHCGVGAKHLHIQLCRDSRTRLQMLRPYIRAQKKFRGGLCPPHPPQKNSHSEIRTQNPEIQGRGGTRTTRNPILMLKAIGSDLRRYAARTCLRPRSHDPPRTTRYFSPKSADAFASPPAYT